MYEELVKNLKSLREDYFQTQDDDNFCFSAVDADMLENAAEAIENLEAENLRSVLLANDIAAKYETAVKLQCKMTKITNKLQSELEHLKNCRHECKIDCLLKEYNKKCNELEEAKEEIESYKNTRYKLQHNGEELTAGEIVERLDELERVKAERDAAVEDLKSQYDIQGIEDDHPIYDMSICFKCIYYPSSFNRYCEDCNNFDKWQWRGVQGGKGND